MKDEAMREKLEEVILSSYEAMYRMAYTYMRNEDNSMDVVQESIVKAIKNSGQLKETAYIKTWLFRILINTALDELKRQKKILPLLTEDEEAVEDRYEDTDVKILLEQLNESERNIIILRFFEEWKIEEIADFMGKSSSTVKSTLYRSLKKLKAGMMKGEFVS